MSSPPFEQIPNIFLAALEQPAERRAAWLKRACAGDLDLHQKVTALLLAHQQSGLIDHPGKMQMSGTGEPHLTEMIGRTISHYSFGLTDEALFYLFGIGEVRR